MSKANASDGYRDGTVRSELSCGGYVSEYDKIELHSYLLHLPIQNGVIMYIDVEEKLNERGNGRDSNDDGDNARDFYNTIKEVELERSRFLLGYDRIEQSDEGGMNSVLLHVGDNMKPYEVKVPKAPEDLVGPEPNTSMG